MDVRVGVAVAGCGVFVGGTVLVAVGGAVVLVCVAVGPLVPCAHSANPCAMHGSEYQPSAANEIVALVLPSGIGTE